jgi:glycosyltransferase involved in cell wall biosynthesis
MGTGCPCIATAVTGCKDFFNDYVGYELKWDIKKTELQNYDLTADGYVPDTEDLAKHMIYVMQNYDDALKKGKRASDRIHRKFTWELSGRRLSEIIKGYYYADIAKAS